MVKGNHRQGHGKTNQRKEDENWDPVLTVCKLKVHYPQDTEHQGLGI